jgi:hypothetical protein
LQAIRPFQGLSRSLRVGKLLVQVLIRGLLLVGVLAVVIVVGITAILRSARTDTPGCDPAQACVTTTAIP